MLTEYGARCAPLLDLFFEPRCAACNTRIRSGVRSLCAGCRESIRLDVRREYPPALYGVPVWSLYSADSALSDLLKRWKYQRDTLAGAMVLEYWRQGLEQMPEAVPRADWVAAPPMFWGKRLWRGFDVGREFCRALQWPVQRVPMRQWIPVRSQVSRRERVRRRRRPPFAIVPGKWQAADVMLVDDVMTTGATLERLAAAVRQGGARSVAGLVLLRVGSER